MKNSNLGAIILAAGKGKRMNSTNFNKVVLQLGGKPMIYHSVSLLSKLGIKTIIVVVGFAKESVLNALKDKNVKFAHQKNQLGVAHALYCGVKSLPSNIKHVLVVNGDDSALYKADIIHKLINLYLSNGPVMAFLTAKIDNPYGLGRVKKTEQGKAIKIIEEKDATEEERKIDEVNLGCYLFQVDFLKKYLPIIKKNNASGEYYLTDLVKLAALNNYPIETMTLDNILWRGVNTKEELAEAEKIFAKVKHNSN